MYGGGGVRFRCLLRLVAGCAERIGCWPGSNADDICCMVDGRLLSRSSSVQRVTK